MVRDFAAEIEKIKRRNARVEADKAWETSRARRMLIALLTYAVVLTFFLVADLPRPFLSSIVPAIAFILSTMTLDFFKKQWLKRSL